jgi:hypothetical protein
VIPGLLPAILMPHYTRSSPVVKDGLHLTRRGIEGVTADIHRAQQFAGTHARSFSARPSFSPRQPDQTQSATLRCRHQTLPRMPSPLRAGMRTGRGLASPERQSDPAGHPCGCRARCARSKTALASFRLVQAAESHPVVECRASSYDDTTPAGDIPTTENDGNPAARGRDRDPPGVLLSLP